MRFLLLLMIFAVYDCSAQGTAWSEAETQIIAKKLYTIMTRPGLVAKQFKRLYPDYKAIPQSNPTPQKVNKLNNSNKRMVLT